MINKPDVNACNVRWLTLLQQFDLTIVDKPSKENVVVDFMYILDLLAGKEGVVDDQLPDEHFAILVLLSWFG